MNWYLDEINELVSDFERNLTPFFDNWVDESQGISIDEKIWLLCALLFFRSYVQGSPKTILAKPPTYEDKGPSPVMCNFNSQKEEIETAILYHRQRRNMKRVFKKLK